MIWGIVVHASTVAPSAFFDALTRVSGLVRMEAFFIISGMLSLHLLRRHGPDGLVVKRCATLGLPLLVGLIVLNPLTNYLVYCFHNEWVSLAAYLTGDTVARPVGPMVWHLHLWFLFALIAYAVATPWMAELVGRAWNRVRRHGHRASRSMLFLGLAAGVVAACFSARLVFEFAVEPLVPDSLWFVCLSTLHYLPFFGLGMLLTQSPRLLASFGRTRWLHLGISALLVMGTGAAFANLPKAVAETWRLASESYLAVALAAALFGAARGLFGRERAWVRRFADASYSIYMLHFLVIYLAATALRPLLGNGGLLILAVIPVTFAGTFFLHHAVVARFALLRALLNGRLPFPKHAAPPHPVGAATPVKLS